MTDIPERVSNLLAEHQTLVLATAGADGQPEAAGAFYTSYVEGGRLAVVCALLSTSRKLEHLHQNPRCGLYIGPQTPTRWLQATARARIVEDGAERDQRLAQLLAGAPGARVFVERVPVTPVVFQVVQLKLTDLTGGHPPVVTIDFEEEAPERAR